jgi:hypothetical protein
MALVTVRVLRAFMWAGAPVAPGAEIDVPPSMAGELAAGGKAIRVEPVVGATEQITEPAPKRRGRPAREQTE